MLTLSSLGAIVSTRGDTEGISTMEDVFEELVRQGRSQRWLARQLGIHYTLLSKYNTGERVAPEEIVRASRRLLGMIASPSVDDMSTVSAAAIL